MDKIFRNFRELLDIDATTLAAVSDGQAFALRFASGKYGATAIPAPDLSGYATTGYVASAIASLVNSAPGTLDTLGEIAAQLASDESVAAALTTTVAGKLAKASNLADLTDVSAALVSLGLGVPTGTGNVVRATSPTLVTPNIGAATGTGLALAAGAITTSQPLALTQTWNAGGVTFTGLKENITDTASAGLSLLMDLQVGGTSKFKVDKFGAVITSGTLLVANTGQSAGVQLQGFGGDVYIDNTAAGDIIFRTSQANIVGAFYPAGGFSIGSALSSPGAGNLGAANLYLNSATVATNAWVGGDSTSNFAGLWMGGNAATHTTSNYTFLYDNGTGDTLFNAKTGGNIFFRVNNATKVELFSSGGLYLGTSPADPGAGNLAVAGGILASKKSIFSLTDAHGSALGGTFDDRSFVIGSSSQGLALSYSATDSIASIAAIAPGVAWKAMKFGATTWTFRSSDTVDSLFIANGVNIGGLTDPGAGNLAVAGSYRNGATKVVSASAIDWATGNTFSKTLSANTTFTFSNAADSQTIIVAITNTASNYTVTWPTVSWAGGYTPVQTTGAKTDIYTFVKVGTTIYGSAVQNF